MKRHFGIDLLKMTAMVMVVAHHVLMTLPKDGCVFSPMANFAVQAFHGWCYCAVDMFVMATGFVMCQKDWCVVRIFRLWRQIVGYSLACAIVAAVCYPTVAVGWRDWLHAVMPVTFDRYWFVTQYVALFFTMPFLNKLLHGMSLREAGKLLLTGFCLLSLSSVWAGRDLFATKWGYTFVWFLFLYLLGGVLSRPELRERVSRWGGFCAIVAGAFMASGADALGGWLSARFGGGARLGELLWSYTSPAILLEAVGMFALFERLDVRSAKWQRLIAFAAPGTFIVYVVHSNEVFRSMVGWKGMFGTLVNFGPPGVVAGSFLCAIGIYAAIAAVDGVRRVLWTRGRAFALECKNGKR